jgi:MFS family permease
MRHSIAGTLARELNSRGIHYGWIVAGTTFFTMLATAGAMGSAGVMIVPLQQEFGWSNAAISTALAVRLALFGVMGPFAAALMNRFGLRVVILAALMLISGGLLLSFAMTQLWQLVVLWGVAVGLGTGMTALVLGATVATRWFVKRRGLVVGLMTASNATGQLVFLPVLARVTHAAGWRVALGFVVGMLAAAFLLVGLLMRDYPQDVGLSAYGETVPRAKISSRRGFAELLTAPVRALRQAAGDQVFLVLFATFFICGLSTNGLIQTHWITLCGDFGVAPVAAAGMLAVIGCFDFVGTIGSGWLSDRLDSRVLLSAFYGLRGLSLIYLPFSHFNVFALSIFAVVYGLDWVSTVPPTVKLAAERFGADRANLTFGWIFAGHQLGAATAAIGAGTTRTAFASYLPAVFAAGAFCLAASVLVMALPGKKKEILLF